MLYTDPSSETESEIVPETEPETETSTDPETETSSPYETAEPTDVPTENTGTTALEPESKTEVSKPGCGSILTCGAVLTVGVAAVALKKKKEED